MKHFKKSFLWISVLFLAFYLPDSFAAKSQTAKEFTGISNWYNSNPLTLESLKGKVVLIEFWSSTCPHCIASMPGVHKLYNKYSKDGLIIIGVHVPLGGQKSPAALKQAIQQHDIKYPVAADNKLMTAHSYGVHELPAFYLIDPQGKVIYRISGSGNYTGLDKNIKKAMASKS